MKKPYLYCDYAATTPVDPRVVKVMMPFLTKDFGNPHSQHTFGKRAMTAVDEARFFVARFFGVTMQEMIFTSGATESNNLALRGVVKALRNKHSKLHIVISAIEHPSILETATDLETDGVELTIVPVQSSGHVRAEDVLTAIRPETCLVSIMLANNEIGTIQPVQAIGKGISKISEARGKNNLPLVFHTDATQAVAWLELSAVMRNVDLLSFSSHKISGPKGVGGLVVREKTPITRMQTGGSHEKMLRAGTLNVPGLVGLSQALSFLPYDAAKMRDLRDVFEKKMLQQIPRIHVVGKEPRLPHISNIAFEGIDQQLFVIHADLNEHLAVSAGSACASGASEASKTIRALGLPKKYQDTTIRFSFGSQTTPQDIRDIVKRCINITKALRKV